jgi:hypothetical protein
MAMVRDSSMYGSPEAYSLSPIGADVRIGIVRTESYDEDLDTIFYAVEVQHSGIRYMLRCRTMVKFGDAYNYEEHGLRTWDYKTKDPLPRSYAKRVGEVVAVLHINQSPTDGLIIGCMRHPAHKSKIKSGVSFASEFNGLETTISNSGAYKVVFKGTPTTVADLRSVSGNSPVPEAKYDDKITGSYLEFDEKGSFTVSDAGKKAQSVKIDKGSGTITIISGDVSVAINRDNKSVAVKSSTVSFESDKSFAIKSPEFSVDSNKTVKIKGNKVAIGSGSVELIDSLIKLIDGLGTITVSSPVGPCSPVKSAPSWAQIEALKSKLSSIKGSL